MPNNESCVSTTIQKNKAPIMFDLANTAQNAAYS